MGKNWKGGGGRGGGRGGGGGGGGGDLASCRGYAAIIGTCDAARERESTKELSNLLNQAIERLGLTAPPTVENEEAESSNKGTESIEDMLRNEVMLLKSQRHSGTQDIISINTGIKGIVLVKISRRDICPVMLVKAVFDQVSEEKVPISRHLVKMIPLQIVFFAGEDEFVNITKLVVEGTFTNPGVTLPRLQLSKVVHKRKSPEESEEVEKPLSNEEELNDGAKRPRTESNLEAESSTEPVPTEEPEAELPVVQPIELVESTITIEPAPVAEPAAVPAVVPTYAPADIIKYMVLFKARNHNTLTKNFVMSKVRECVPPYVKQDYLLAQNVVIVEALKNIGGISYFPDFFSYADLNLRKHQATVCPQTVSSHILAAAESGAGKEEPALEGKEEILAETLPAQE